MTLTEFYLSHVPKMLGSARRKITSPHSFTKLTPDETIALALWADCDVIVDDDEGEFAGARTVRPLEISIVDGRYEVRDRKEMDEANGY